MINWFEIFADKLTALEEGQKEIRALLTQSSTSTDSNPYGSFKWLCETCSDIPPSTLRIKSAAGEIPGVIKFGKRVLYEKTAVLNWLHSLTRKAIDTVAIECTVNQQLSKISQKRSIAK